MTLEATLLRFEACLASEQQEVEEQKESRGQVKRWRTRQGVLQVKVASPTREASPIAGMLNLRKCFVMCEPVEEEDFLLNKDI